MQKSAIGDNETRVAEYRIRLLQVVTHLRNRIYTSQGIAIPERPSTENKDLKITDEAILFAHRPNEMIIKKLQDWSKPAYLKNILLSILIVPGWIIVLLVPISAVYSLGFENKIFTATGYTEAGIMSLRIGSQDIELFCFDPDKSRADSLKPSSVNFVGMCIYLNRFAFFEIEVKPSNSQESQTVSFSFGPAVLELSNVNIQNLGKDSYPKIFLFLYAFITVLCLHPPAKFLAKKQSLTNVFRTSVLFFVYVMTITVVIFFAAAVSIVHVFNLTENYGVHSATGLSGIVFAVLMIRGFFSIYPKLYGVTKKRMLVILLSGMFVSYVVSPIYLTLGV